MMLKMIPALLLAYAAVSNAMSQGPPPALIYSAPTEKQLVSYVSREYKFRAIFAGEIKVTETNLLPDVAVVDFRNPRIGADSFVQVIRYRRGLKLTDNEIRLQVRERILTQPEAKIVEEREFKSGKLAGSEIRYTTGYVFHRLRILKVGKRIYQIGADVTNWHILTRHMKHKVEEFERESSRFFDSFSVLK